MIHESAIISKNAEIPDDIQIGVNCVIGDNVKIGKKCILNDNVRIVGNTTIGNGNIFFSNSVIGEIPQDKKYHGEKPFLIIGDNNTFREFVTINTGTFQVEVKRLLDLRIGSCLMFILLMIVILEITIHLQIVRN